MRLLFVFIFLITTLVANYSFAIEEAKILPKGIHSPVVRFGVVDGLDHRYTKDGELANLSQFYSVEVDANALRQQSPDAEAFINILNQFGTYNLGDQLHLGTIIPEVEPEITYTAPIYSMGLTKNWTMAVGFPVFHYKNKMGFAVTGSNVSQIRPQVEGDIEKFDEAFNQLNIDLIDTLETKLATAGYYYGKRDEWIFGDVQVASLYQMAKNPDWAVLLKTTLNLPTGPKDDPSDLLDLDFLGRTAFDTNVLAQYWLFKKFSLVGKVGYKFYFPDKAKKRVPKNAQDQLPGPETEEKIYRDLGDVALVEIKSLYAPESFLLFELGVSHSEKQKDRYSGTRNQNYALLGENTQSRWNTFILGAELSTIDFYKTKKFAVPLLVAYHYNDIFSGVNKERQSIHEISLSMFF